MIQLYFLRSGLVLSLLLWSIAAISQDILWEKSLGGKHADYLFDAVPTADYGFLLAGSSLSGKTGRKTDKSNGDLDYWLWKMNEEGEQEWQKSFGADKSDILQSVVLTKDAGFLLVGTSDSDKTFHKKDSCRGNTDIWIIKLNAQGGEEWQKTIGGASQELVSSVKQTPDGGFIIAASSSSDKSAEKENDSFGGLDYWIIKIDGKGKIEWQHTYGGLYNDIVKKVVCSPDGGYLVGGYSNSPESGTKTEKNYGIGDYWIIKLDNKGEIVWQKTLGGDKDDQLHDLIVTKNGDYLIGGNSNSGVSNYKKESNRLGTDFWVIRMDKDGELIWQQTYNFGKQDILSSLIEEEDESIIIGGYARGITTGKKKQEGEVNDYAIIKVKPDGEEIWKRTLGSTGEEMMQKVILTRDGGYLLTGTSNGKASGDKKGHVGNNDFWVVKLKDEKKPKKEKASIEAFPNPVVQFTNVIIGYEYEKGTCAVYDLGGRQLQRFDIAKDRTIPVDLGNLPQGIYIIEINTEKRKDGIKIMKSLNLK
jgi:hypothetical protein